MVFTSSAAVYAAIVTFPKVFVMVTPPFTVVLFADSYSLTALTEEPPKPVPVVLFASVRIESDSPAREITSMLPKSANRFAFFPAAFTR